MTPIQTVATNDLSPVGHGGGPLPIVSIDTHPGAFASTWVPTPDELQALRRGDVAVTVFLVPTPQAKTIDGFPATAMLDVILQPVKV